MHVKQTCKSHKFREMNSLDFIYFIFLVRAQNIREIIIKYSGPWFSHLLSIYSVTFRSPRNVAIKKADFNLFQTRGSLINLKEDEESLWKYLIKMVENHSDKLSLTLS